MKKERKKVVVAVSGGVDSAVVAKLLCDQGYEVIGVFMRLFDYGSESERAARLICKNLGIKFYPVNLSERFSEEVKKYFLESYQNGLTPNPCVRCNKIIKFGELLKVKEVLSADFLATGHYIKKVQRKIENIFEYSLERGLDPGKDQSYFLYNLTQKQLSDIIFPLGNLTKAEVIIMANKAAIPHLKGESQDVCFLFEDGKIIDHNDYLKERLILKPGYIKTMDEKVIGEHQGLPLYTIGQRRGVEIGGTGPYYVSNLDYETNTLYVVNDVNDPALFRKEFTLSEVNWISAKEPVFPFACDVVIRYRHKKSACTVFRKEKNYHVKLKTPERAITSGQSAVFYGANELLGGGVIC